MSRIDQAFPSHAMTSTHTWYEIADFLDRDFWDNLIAMAVRYDEYGNGEMGSCAFQAPDK